MYRRLPHGPHGMDREDVARHQRARLYGGMIESVSSRGYGATTVAHVIGLAGVSRRVFYEQFANKEECFLATYDIIIARSRKLVMDAWTEEYGWASRVHAAYKTLLDDIAGDPKGPRLVLVDALGIGPKARERLQLAACTYERLLSTAFEVAPDGIKLPPLTVKAIVGGIRHVAFMRVYEHRERELLNLTDELLDWVDSYRSSPAARLGVTGLTQPPNIPSTPVAFLSGDDKRSRVLGAVVHLTLDESYAELTDPQIAQFAGVSTEAFHKLFASKEECFLTVVDEFIREALATVSGAVEGASSWPEAVRLAVAAILEYCVAHPALLRMAFIDIYEVGPGMVSRLAKSIEGFTSLLDETGPVPRRAPAIASEAVAGAVWEIVSNHAATDRLRYLPCLVDHITFIVLAPYVGPKVAIEAIEEARGGPRAR